MTVPRYPDKHGAPAVLTPAHHVERLEKQLPSVPEAVVLAFQPSLVEEAARRAEGRYAFAGGNLYVLERPGGRVGVLGDFAFGAPVAATEVEYLAEVGAETVAILGGGGGCSRTFTARRRWSSTRPSGTRASSHHYLEPARTDEATPALVEGFER